MNIKQTFIRCDGSLESYREISEAYFEAGATLDPVWEGGWDYWCNSGESVGARMIIVDKQGMIDAYYDHYIPMGFREITLAELKASFAGLTDKELNERENDSNTGYHLRPISPQGVYGEISKIEEELDELKEAMEQNNVILALVEAADLLGALEGFLEQHFDNVSLYDLQQMSDATKRAFLSGKRKSK